MKHLLTVLLILSLLLSADSKKTRRKSSRKPKPKPKRQPKQKNCYEKLGVPTDSSDRQIKKSFRKLAMKYHPDKVKQESERETAEAKFKELAHCYELLSDKDKRQKYDASGYNEEFAGQSGGANGFNFQGNFEDIFANFFGDGGPGFGFENMFTQSSGGGGPQFGFSFGGDGGPGFGQQFGNGGRQQRQRAQQPNMYGQHHTHSNKKPKPQKVYIDLENLMEDTFMSANVKNRGAIELEIPKGCPDGHIINENGIDFAVYTNVNKDYTRGTLSHKSDLYTNVSITLEQALLGFNLEVMSIENELIEEWIDYMPHSREYQIKRKGLPRFGKDASTRGHLYIRFDVQLPKLSEKEREDLKEHLEGYGGWDYSEARKYRMKQEKRRNRRRRNRDKSEL